jgi:gamma-glutamylputrescine oxidase
MNKKGFKGISIWEKETLFNDIDFLIIGGGFTGKYIALLLTESYPGKRIVILERQSLGGGASTRNAGFATFGNVSEIIEDMKNHDTTKIIELIRKRYQGLEWIKQRWKAEDYDFQITGGYELFENQQQEDKALNQLDTINQIMFEATGLRQVFKIKQQPDKQFNFKKNAIYNPYEGMLHPGKLNRILEVNLYQKNVEIRYGINVTGIKENFITTSEKKELHAKQIFVCTNGYTSSLIAKSNIIPARGQIIVTNPLTKPIHQGIYHSQDGYIYFRTLHHRILIGGGRNWYEKEEETTREETKKYILEYLKNYLKEYIITKEKFKIDYHWAGIMGMHQKKIPHISKQKNGSIVCAGLGGIGVAIAPIVAAEAVMILHSNKQRRKT